MSSLLFDISGNVKIIFELISSLTYYDAAPFYVCSYFHYILEKKQENDGKLKKKITYG